MLKPKFTFRVSEEFLKESPLYTAELMQNNEVYRIIWDCFSCYDEKQEVQEFINSGRWIIQEEEPNDRL